jgi:hypothetical protein
MGPGLADEKKRDKGDEFRQNRQKGFLDSAICLFYFYIMFAAAFKFPTVSRQELFHSE